MKIMNWLFCLRQKKIQKVVKPADISKFSIHRILQSYKFHPYHVELDQELYGDGFSNRIAFCIWLLNKIREVPNFLSNILLSNEATFKTNGVLNKHNMHYYATENPH